MQAHYIKLPKHLHEAVHIRKDITMNFYQNWHYHDEIELVYILKGSGTRFIGDHMANFGEGDLLLVGSHLPHLWRNELPDDGQPPKAASASAIVVQFPMNFGADGLLDINEMSAVKKLLIDSQRGFSFNLPERHPIKLQIKNMLKQPPLERLLSMVRLLNAMAETEQKELLSGIRFADHYQKHSSRRMDEIYNYILNHFNREITLAELASMASMTASSLCRFFKQSTGKPISTFINEVRIGYACKLLIDDKRSISEVCFQCGYNNLSYFNRQFRKHTGSSPTAYLNRFNLNPEQANPAYQKRQ